MKERRSLEYGIGIPPADIWRTYCRETMAAVNEAVQTHRLREDFAHELDPDMIGRA